MEVSGIGLHTGARVRVVARPAAASEGIYFVRTDLGGEPRIAASIASVTDTRLSTTLGDGDGASVRTVEHLLSALCGAGVRACRVEIDGPELPLLDGSAAPWVTAILGAGVAPMAPGAGGAAPLAARLKAPCWVHEGDAWVVALPAEAPRCASTLTLNPHPHLHPRPRPHPHPQPSPSPSPGPAADPNPNPEPHPAPEPNPNREPRPNPEPRPSPQPYPLPLPSALPPAPAPSPAACPCALSSFAYGIEFASHPPIGTQWCSWAPPKVGSGEAEA